MGNRRVESVAVPNLIKSALGNISEIRFLLQQQFINEIHARRPINDRLDPIIVCYWHRSSQRNFIDVVEANAKGYAEIKVQPCVNSSVGVCLNELLPFVVALLSCNKIISCIFPNYNDLAWKWIYDYFHNFGH